MKLRVLVLVPHYLPGFRYGGPTRTVAAIVERLGSEIDFHVLTSDRDYRSPSPFPGITADRWTERDGASVMYASPSMLHARRLIELIGSTPHDVLYLNTYFETRFTTLPLAARRAGFFPPARTIVSPQGVLSPGAIRLKHAKKAAFLAAANVVRLHRDLVWQASSESEAVDIRRWIGEDARVLISPDFPPAPDFTAAHRPRRNGEPIRISFVSRISRKKNLDYAIAILSRLEIPFTFDIYGPLEDEEYWAECRAAIDRLPRPQSVRYHGAVEPNEVPAVLASSDLFLFPTRGENFGHVIVEALNAGTPVLISDSTPWRSLESQGLGWDFSLDSMDPFVNAIRSVAKRTEAEAAASRAHIRIWAQRRAADPDLVAAKQRLFTGD